MFMIFIELFEFIHWGGIGKWFEFQDWERKFYVMVCTIVLWDRDIPNHNIEPLKYKLRAKRLADVHWQK